MVAPSPIQPDALLLGLAMFTRVCAEEDRKAGKRMLRRTVRRLQESTLPVGIRSEAIRAIQRGCGACKGCKGA